MCVRQPITSVLFDDPVRHSYGRGLFSNVDRATHR